MHRMPKKVSHIFTLQTILFLFIQWKIIGSDKKSNILVPSTLTFQRFGKQSHIAYLESNGMKYLAKLPNSKDMLVAELFGSTLAEEMEIPLNRVAILPKNTHIKTKTKEFQTIKPFLKEMEKRVSKSGHSYEPILTLHTYIEGSTLKKNNPLNIDIQGLHDPKNIRSISYHKNLCELLTLDLFTSNNDRHPGNVIQTLNGYTGIDEDHCYGSELHYITMGYGRNLQNLHSLSEKEINLLKEFLPETGVAFKARKYLETHNETSLKKESKEALVFIRSKLIEMQQKYSDQDLCNLWMKKCNEINFNLNESQKFVFTAIITHNYENVAKLIKELDRFV